MGPNMLETMGCLPVHLIVGKLLLFKLGCQTSYFFFRGGFLDDDFGLFERMLAHFGICLSAALSLNFLLQWGHGIKCDVSEGGGGGKSESFPPLARMALASLAALILEMNSSCAFLQSLFGGSGLLGLGRLVVLGTEWPSGSLCLVISNSFLFLLFVFLQMLSWSFKRSSANFLPQTLHEDLPSGAALAAGVDGVDDACDGVVLGLAVRGLSLLLEGIGSLPVFLASVDGSTFRVGIIRRFDIPWDMELTLDALSAEPDFFGRGSFFAIGFGRTIFDGIRSVFVAMELPPMLGNLLYKNVCSLRVGSIVFCVW